MNGEILICAMEPVEQTKDMMSLQYCGKAWLRNFSVSDIRGGEYRMKMKVISLDKMMRSLSTIWCKGPVAAIEW